MWSTGFVVNSNSAIEDEHSSAALEWMQCKAAEHSCALCGSLSVKTTGGTFRNRHYFVTPDKTVYYDKHHLFTPGNEGQTYQAGTRHTIAEWKGVRFLLMTCYDLRFPLWSRYGLAGEYDAIIYVANWPESRQMNWEVLTHARAIENQCYVIGCNRVGDDPQARYCGGSLMIDPIGRDVIVSKNNAEQSLSGQLSIESLHKARHHFPVLHDRDDYPIV
jgi:predicted amidohydrolase